MDHPCLDVKVRETPAADLWVCFEQRADRGAGARPLVIGCDDHDLVVAIESGHRLDEHVESACVDPVVVRDHQAHQTILARGDDCDLNDAV